MTEGQIGRTIQITGLGFPMALRMEGNTVIGIIGGVTRGTVYLAMTTVPGMKVVAVTGYLEKVAVDTSTTEAGVVIKGGVDVIFGTTTAGTGTRVATAIRV